MCSDEFHGLNLCVLMSCHVYDLCVLVSCHGYNLCVLMSHGAVWRKYW